MQPTILSARTAELDDGQRDAVVRLCIAAHDNPAFDELFSLVPPDGLHTFAYAGDELIGHAVLTTRWLQHDGGPLLRTGYVDAVSTAPDRQGQGVGSAVMRNVETLAAEEFEIACLETERQGFYARLGWEEWRGSLAGRAEDGSLIATPDQKGIMILRLPRTPELDLDGSLSVERQPKRIW